MSFQHKLHQHVATLQILDKLGLEYVQYIIHVCTLNLPIFLLIYQQIVKEFDKTCLTYRFLSGYQMSNIQSYQE